MARSPAHHGRECGLRVQLGDRVKDTISGIEGIANARTVYLNGCVQIAVETPPKDDVLNAQWVDEFRLVVLEAGSFKLLSASDER